MRTQLAGETPPGRASRIWSAAKRVGLIRIPPRARSGGAPSSLDALIERNKVFRVCFGIYALIGAPLGFIAAAATFLAVYVFAIESAGWVIGMTLGLFPACLAAMAAFFVIAYGWPIALPLLLSLFH